MDMAQNLSLWKNRYLSIRLLLYVTAFSLLFSLLVSAIQLYYNYQHDKRMVYANLEFIKESYVPAITTSAYNMDEPQLSLQLKGALQLQDVEYLEVTEFSKNNPHRIFVGNPDVEKAIIDTFALTYTTIGHLEISVGTLMVKATLANVFQRLKERAALVLIVNAMAVLLWVFAVFVIFQVTFARHLTKIADYTQKLDFDKMDEILDLNRCEGKFLRPDELDHLAKAINDLRMRLKEGIWARRQAEKEKEKLEAQLRQSQKMEAIGTLAGGIAHEFNNVLGIIIGNTELSIEDTPADSPVQEFLRQIEIGSMRAKNIVRQLLNFSRNAKIEPKAIDMTALLKESIELVRASIPTTIDMQNEIEPDICKVTGDATQIYQIIFNLCTNAAHAMSDNGGTLGISLHNLVLESSRSFYHGHLPPGRYTELSISDTGNGMEDALLDRIFDPFFTTKEVGAGTGMGLSVVHGIVQNHGGAIHVESMVGRGSTFTVLLPCSEDGVLPTDDDYKAPSTGNGKILFIDDETAITNMGTEVLKRLGYSVSAHTDPVTALECFRAEPQSYDLVITDMTMPKMTGALLAKEMLKTRTDLPIILCTGYNEKIDQNVAASIGIKLYFEKPITRKKLGEAVRRALGKLS